MKENSKEIVKKCYILITAFIYVYLLTGIYNIKANMGVLPFYLKDGWKYLYKNSYTENQCLPILLIAGILYLYKKDKIELKAGRIAMSFGLSIICNLAIVYWENYGMSMIVADKYNVFFFLFLYFTSISFYLLLINALNYLFKIIFNIMKVSNENEKKSNLYYVLILLLAWLPYVILFFPGRISGDAMWALISFATERINDKHSVGYTYLVGGIMCIGKRLLNADFGILLNVLFQVILSITAIVYSTAFVCRRIGNRVVDKVIIVFFALCPIIPLNVVTMQTDIIYCNLLLITIVYFIKNILDEKKYKSLNDIKFGILIVVTSLFRKEGIIILMLTLVGVFLLYKSLRSRIFKMAIAVIPLFLLVNMTLENNIYSVGDSGLYKYSVVLQQSARYVKYYPNEVTSKEKSVIDNIVEYDKLSENYNPILSDNIIGLYKKDVQGEKVLEYFKVWFRMLLKHPGVYVDAFINNCYGYLSPFSNREAYIIGDGILNDTLLSTNKEYYYDILGCKHYEDGIGAITLVENVLNELQYIPFLNILYIPSMYVWIVISLSLLSLIKRKKNDFVVMIPYILVVCVALMSPANGHLRYLYSIIISLPIWILVLYEVYNKNSSKCD